MGERGAMQVGQVIEAFKGPAGPTVRVRVRRRAMCGSCGRCASAGVSGDLVVEAADSLGSSPGDLVAIELDAGKIVRTAFVVYLLPLVMMGTGAALSWFLLKQAATAWFGAAAGAAAWYAYLRFYDRKAREDRSLLPEVTAVLGDDETEPSACVSTHGRWAAG